MGWYQSLSRGKQITVLVVITHGFLLCMLGADHWMHRVKRNSKKIVVHYVQPHAEQVSSRKMELSSVVVDTKPKKQPPPKKLNKPIASISKTDKPKKDCSRTESVATDSLLLEIEKKLESLSAHTPALKKSTITVPDFAFKPTECSATEQIISLLQKSLELPEFGSVKLKLSVSASGNLEEVVIVETKSQKNGDFLKKRLPELQFPCLNEDITLTIVFSNAL